MKLIKDDGFNNFRNNLPFTIYIKNKTKKINIYYGIQIILEM